MKRYPLSYNPILEYYEQIKNGKVTVCDKIRKWYKHLSNKVINPTDGYHYEAKRGNHIIEFVENYCRHSKGKMGGQLVKLELWEKAWLPAVQPICVNYRKKERQVFACLCNRFVYAHR